MQILCNSCFALVRACLHRAANLVAIARTLMAFRTNVSGNSLFLVALVLKMCHIIIPRETVNIVENYRYKLSLVKMNGLHCFH